MGFKSIAASVDVSQLLFFSLCVGLMLTLIFAARIVRKVLPSKTKEQYTVAVIRIVKLASLVTLIIVGLLHQSSPFRDEQTSYEKTTYLIFLTALYGVLFFSFTDYIRRRYGRVYSYNTWAAKDGKYSEVKKTERVDTYKSRTYIVVAKVLLTILFVTFAIDIVGDNKIYQASAAVAFLALLVGFSQSAWIPDLVNGLIILQSEMYKEGDILRIKDSGEIMTGEVFKIKYFNTELLNLIDNHRVTIRNSKMRDYTIHNLSRYASSFGLRQKLTFKIGYEVDERKVKSMFKDAFDQVLLNETIEIEADRDPEFRIEDAGDHAVEWCVYYDTKREKKVLRTRQSIIELVLSTSKEHDISLATPITHQVSPMSDEEIELS